MSTIALAVVSAAVASAAPTPRVSGAALVARLGRPGRTRAWVADVIYRAQARSAPDARARRLGEVPAVSGWGTPTDLLVLAARVGPEGRLWLRVLLDRRPNGAAVWLNANDTLLHTDPWRVTVSLRHRQVTVARAGRRLRAFAAVVGKPATPTPMGLFAIAAELRQPEPDQFVGSWVLPLTAHSNVLRSFDGGDGQVALHGRGGASLLDPLGSARSHGCVRLANSAIAWIATHVPVGPP